MLKLSVIVCTFNREKYIQQTLQYLHDQSADRSLYEVLIIDNNSTDNTPGICKAFISEPGHFNFHYFPEKQQGHTFARNRGISESKGDYIAFLDDDAWVNADYCQSVINFFDEHPEVMAIGGKITPVYEGATPGWMSRYLLPLVAGLDMGEDVKMFKSSKYPIGANMAFRAAVFQKYGTFNTRLGRRGKGLEGGDEKDMIFRLKKDGLKVCYVPYIHVRHIIPESRIQMGYIKGQAIGVGTSEKKRLAHENLRGKLNKIIEEIIKIIGSMVLAFYYLLTFRPEKGIMLLRFRFWVIRGFFQLSHNE